jgi:hypothetical protein
VTFALWDGALWSAIDRKPKRREPARIRYLARRPDASLTVDRYAEDWADLAWVQVLGRVEILALKGGDSETPPDERSNRAVEGALAALSDKYPQYRDEPPPGPLLRLDPRRTLCWRAR